MFRLQSRFGWACCADPKGVRHGPLSLSHHLALLSGILPDDLPALVQDLPQDVILQALWATGTIRRRRLPAEQFVWLVLCFAM